MQPETAPQQPTFQTTNNVAPARPKKSRKLLLILLVLLLIAGAAAAGWWYGTDQATKKADQQISELQEQIDALNKKVQELESTAETKESDDDFVVVKDWNIKFAVTDPTLNYEINSTDKNNLILFTDTSKTIGEKCFPDYDKTFGISVTRSATKLSGDDLVYKTFIKEINGNNYYSSFPDGGCEVASERANLAKVTTDLETTAKTISAK